MARRTVPAPVTPTGQSSVALDALTGDTPVRVQHGDVALDLIDPDPANPERRSAEIDEDLAASIAEEGVWTPVLLRPNPTVTGRWWLIAGHRRVVHARHVGLTVIPATMLPERTDLQALRTLLGENIHRQDLRISEEAQLVQGLLDLGIREADLVREVHKSATWVRARRQVARLPKDTQALIDGREITLTQVEQIDRFADHQTLYSKLVESLGTDQLQWRIAEADRSLKDETAMTRTLETLVKAGVALQRGKAPRTSGPDRTHDQVGAMGPGASQRTGQRTSAKELKALAAAHEDLVAVKHTDSWGQYFELVVPHRTEPDVDPEVAAAAAANQAADQAHRDALAVAAGEAAIARGLRVGFVVEVLTGERALTKDHVAELSHLAVREALRRYNYGDHLPRLVDWVVLAGRLPDAGVRGALEQAYAFLPAGAPALLYLAATIEGNNPASESFPTSLGAAVWLDGFGSALAESMSEDTWATPRGWYALLVRLGYEPSPAEQTALTRAAPEPAT